MKAFVMAAGVGTRLEPLTLAVPKPMVPVCNVPIMEYNINLLKKHGLTDITANLHYFPEQIEKYFKDGSSFGVNMNYSFEEELMGTAGGVKKMAGLSGLSAGENAVILSSDVLTEIDLSMLLKFHRDKGSKATVALVEVGDTSEYGVVVTDSMGRITAFQEKPKQEEALSRTVNSGVYILEKDVIDLIPVESFYDFGKNLFPLLIRRQVPFFGLPSKAYWKDIGNIRNYISANFNIAAKRKVVTGKNCRIDASAALDGTVILGDNCRIEKGAAIHNCVIWDGVRIGKDSMLENSVIGSGVTIDKGCSIGKHSVIANGNYIGDGSVLLENTFLPPVNPS